ncbi:adenylyltransferase/cytidyltransferase family protein [Lentilactobacillus raoultii]|uniref:FAD synthase n=1 Tax=Lentilactobacillus raoultii TaxID=1987503 RepID=A0ABW3PJ41_9LACO
MQIIYLNSHHQHAITPPKQPIVLALGFFDGVHKGHQFVIQTAAKIASKKRLPLAVMTFNRHASRIFNHGPSASFRYLTTLKQKAELIKKLHADILYVVDFNHQFASLSPKAFINRYVIGLNAKIVVAGFDYTFGQGGTTTIDSMAAISDQLIKTVTVKELDSQHTKISSTRIRKLISQGKITEANRLLGHSYETTGKLIRAQIDGLSIVNPSSRLQQLPKTGNYLCDVTISNQKKRLSVHVHQASSHHSPAVIYVNRALFHHLPHINSLPVTIEWLSG